jgi:hypothetical protein
VSPPSIAWAAVTIDCVDPPTVAPAVAGMKVAALTATFIPAIAERSD